MSEQSTTSDLMTPTEDAPRTVGRLTIRTPQPRDTPSSEYRRPPGVALELLFVGAPSEAVDVRRGRITLLMLVLATLLLGFAVRVQSLPAILTVGVAVAGLLLLVVVRFFSRDAPLAERIRVDENELVVGPSDGRPTSTEPRFSSAMSDVTGFGVGEDAPLRTLWVSSRDRGRQLLLEGLTEEEAEAACAALWGAVQRRQLAVE